MNVNETWPSFVRLHWVCYLAHDILTFETWQIAHNQSALLVDSVDFFDILGMLVWPSAMVFDWTTHYKYFWINNQSTNMKRES